MKSYIGMDMSGGLYLSKLSLEILTAKAAYLSLQYGIEVPSYEEFAKTRGSSHPKSAFIAKGTAIGAAIGALISTPFALAGGGDRKTIIALGPVGGAAMGLMASALATALGTRHMGAYANELKEIEAQQKALAKTRQIEKPATSHLGRQEQRDTSSQQSALPAR